MLLFRIYVFISLVVSLIWLLEKKVEKISNEILNLDSMKDEILNLNFNELDKNQKKRKLIKTLIEYAVPCKIIFLIFSLFSIYFLYLAINALDIYSDEGNRILMIIVSVTGIIYAFDLIFFWNINYSSDESNLSDKTTEKIIKRTLNEIFSWIYVTAVTLSGGIFMASIIGLSLIGFRLEKYESTSTTKIVALNDNVSANINGGLFFVGTTPAMNYVYIPKSQNNEVNIQILSSEDGKVTIHPKDAGSPRIVETTTTEIRAFVLFFKLDRPLNKTFDIYIPNDIIYQYNIDLE